MQNSIVDPHREPPDPELVARIAAAWRELAAEVAEAARAAGRDPAAVRVVAVTKRFPLATLVAARAAGIRRFGENYVRELAEKMGTLADPGLEWHLIGPVQRRYVNRIPPGPLWVHTLDRPEVVERFRRVRPGPEPVWLVQVNVGREPQKAGVLPEELPALLEQLAALEPPVLPAGLMTIPPAGSADAARRWFAELRRLGERLAAHTGRRAVELSMGMSGDFRAAIAEGATLVRVGTRLFGPRPSG